MKISHILIFSTLLLTGCAGSYGAPVEADLVIEEAGEKPSNEKTIELVKLYIKNTFKDPYTVKDLAIYEAVPGKAYGIGKWPLAWIVCFESNARNSHGAYTGLETDAFVVINSEMAPDNISGVHTLAYKYCKYANNVIHKQE